MPYTSLRDYVVKRRGELGLTQRELAQRSGLPIKESYIAQLERGFIKRPGRPHLDALARGLGVSVRELLGEVYELRGEATGTGIADGSVALGPLPLAFIPGEIPIIGRASAGGRDDFPDSLTVVAREKDEDRYKRVLIVGACMGDKYPPGAYAIVDTWAEAVVGKVVTVQIGPDEFLIKRLKSRNGTWVLAPDAPGFAEVTVRPDETVRFIGLVTGVFWQE